MPSPDSQPAGSGLAQPRLPDFDAVLFVSFGGPEGREDVFPFLENVLRGRRVPRERMLAVAEHYYLFDGISPINERNRQLISGLRSELDAHGPRLPIYWGNRNWHPLLTDTVREMQNDGVRRAIAFVTSAYSSYSSCRQYLENIAAARSIVGPDAPAIEKIRPFYSHPLFVQANIENVSTAVKRIPPDRREHAQLIFTAHSIPLSMAQKCLYEDQLKKVSKLVADALGHDDWMLAFQSRSGDPSQPWLGPDILEALKSSQSSGIRDVCVAPIGFVSDHMEVIYDLDVEAKRQCDAAGVNLVRAETAGTHPAFVKMIRELILEKIHGTEENKPGENCASDCCLLN